MWDPALEFNCKIGPTPLSPLNVAVYQRWGVRRAFRTKHVVTIDTWNNVLECERISW